MSKTTNKKLIVGLRPWTAAGPGWSNFGLDVLVQDQLTNKIEARCIQGRKLSARASDLFTAILRIYDMLEEEAEKAKMGERIQG